MSDQDVIKGAYEDALKNLFNVFFQSFAEASGDKKQIDAAKQQFNAGVTVARTARDMAMSLV